MSTNFENSEENNKEILLDLADSISNQNGIHVNPVIFKGLGYDFAQAVMLSQYFYVSSSKNGEEFLYQDDNFLFSIGSPDKIKRAKKALKEKGFIKVTLKGLPAKSYIKVNHELIRRLKIENARDTFETIPEYMRPSQVCAKSTNWVGAGAQTTNKDINKDNIKENTKRSLETEKNIPASGSPSSPKVDELRLAEEIFENRFWVLVPNKVGKEQSKQRFFQITNNCKNEKKVNEVIEGYKRYIDYLNKCKNNDFNRRPKDPSTFLNVKNKSWLDTWEFIDEETVKKDVSSQIKQPKDLERRIGIARKLNLLDQFLPDEYNKEWKFIPKEIKEILISDAVENVIKQVKSKEDSLITQIACVTMMGRQGYINWKDKYEEETGERPTLELEDYIPFDKKLPSDIWCWLLKYSHKIGLPSDSKIEDVRKWFYKNPRTPFYLLFA